MNFEHCHDHHEGHDQEIAHLFEHEQAHVCDSTCQHLGNLCLQGLCGHPEHILAVQDQFNQFEQELMHNSDEYETDETGTKAKLKKRTKKRKATGSERIIQAKLWQLTPK